VFVLREQVASRGLHSVSASRSPLIYCKVCRSLGLAGRKQSQCLCATLHLVLIVLFWLSMGTVGWLKMVCALLLALQNTLCNLINELTSTSCEELVPLDAKYSGLLITSWL
jgi:hypothetical protein